MNRSQLNSFRATAGLGQGAVRNNNVRSGDMYNSPYQPQRFNGRQNVALISAAPAGPVAPNFNNLPGGMTTTVDEINAPVKPGMDVAKPMVDDPAGGGNAPLQPSPALGSNAPGGMGQPAMPQFSRFGGANRQPGMLAPTQDYMRNQLDLRRRLRDQGPKPTPPSGGNGGYLDPTDPYVGA